MKKVIVFAVVLLCFSLVGCSSKTAVTTDGFSSAVEAAGYEYYDITDQYSPEDAVAVIAAEKDDMHIDLFVLHTVEDAAATFATNKSNLEPLEGGAATTSTSMANYNSYTLTTSDSYYIVSRIEDTVLYAVADKGSKQEISELVKSMGH